MRVTAPDYEEGAVAISDLPMDSRIPAIALRRRARHRGESMSTSHLSAPDAAVASFHAAMRAMADPSGVALAEVLKHLNAATEAYPGFAQAWYETGRVHLAAGNPRQAAVALKRSVEVDTWFVSPYEPLILSLRAIGLDAEAAAACAGLRRINPAIPPGCPSGRTQ